MKINLKDLKSFKDNASTIKTNTLIPVLSYIKFDNGKVTKNSLDQFITQDIDFTGQFLVDERILFNFISTASGDIAVTNKSGKIILDDGFTKVTSPAGDFDAFPSNDIAEGEQLTITREVIDAIATASKFINPNGTSGYDSYVFVANGYVAGCDNWISYLEPYRDTLPNMILSKESCAAIARLNGAKFSENDSYYFFESDGVKYGFIKPEQAVIDFTPFTRFSETQYFVAPRQEFVKFNDVCLNSGQAKVLTANMTMNGKLTLIMKDNDYGVDVVKELEATGSADSFNFNPAIMNRLLKSLPENHLKFIKADKKYYIKGDSDYITLIMQMQ